MCGNKNIYTFFFQWDIWSSCPIPAHDPNPHPLPPICSYPHQISVHGIRNSRILLFLSKNSRILHDWPHLVIRCWIRSEQVPCPLKTLPKTSSLLTLQSDSLFIIHSGSVVSGHFPTIIHMDLLALNLNGHRRLYCTHISIKLWRPEGLRLNRDMSSIVYDTTCNDTSVAIMYLNKSWLINMFNRYGERTLPWRILRCTVKTPLK